ncbi:MAG: hypothetical protein QME81_02855 [bacterium]|nr:hypothetical protein [bacterium]
MKIDLTQREYERLLDMLYIAEWVMNACKVEDDPRTEAYKELEQKIFGIFFKSKGKSQRVQSSGFTVPGLVTLRAL